LLLSNYTPGNQAKEARILVFGECALRLRFVNEQQWMAVSVVVQDQRHMLFHSAGFFFFLALWH
jgi:hypothetical protein